MCIYVLTSIHKPLLLIWPSIMGWDYFYSALLRVWAQRVTLKLQEQLSEPKERSLLLTVHTEVNVPLALSRSVDCHTRVCPRVTELGTGQCQHPAPRQDLQQEHSTFRHIPMPNTGGGTPRAPFKKGTFVLPLLPTISLHSSVLFQSRLEKQNSNFMPVPKELLALSRLCRIWTPLPPTSFKHAVTLLICALSWSHRTQIPPLPFQIIKSTSKNQPQPLILSLKYLLISEVGFLFWITVVCNELSRSLQQRKFALLPSKQKICWCKFTQYDISWKDHFISMDLYLPLHTVLELNSHKQPRAKGSFIIILNPPIYSLPLNCTDLKTPPTRGNTTEQDLSLLPGGHCWRWTQGSHPSARSG